MKMPDHLYKNEHVSLAASPTDFSTPSLRGPAPAASLRREPPPGSLSLPSHSYRLQQGHQTMNQLLLLDDKVQLEKTQSTSLTGPELLQDRPAHLALIPGPLDPPVLYLVLLSW